jgi:hypothetical protein
MGGPCFMVKGSMCVLFRDEKTFLFAPARRRASGYFVVCPAISIERKYGCTTSELSPKIPIKTDMERRCQSISIYEYAS